jgi:8-oxo-dGTP diphosphatase
LRNRGSVILIQDKKVGLIKRIKEDSVYYVFPGGGIENGETPEEATKREAFEELGVVVKVNECLAKVEFNGTQYFFICEIISGTFGTGAGEEFTYKKSDRGVYIPTWVDIEKLLFINVKPKEVALKVQSLFN